MPGLMPRYSPGMGVRGFPLTSALLVQKLTNGGSERWREGMVEVARVYEGRAW